MIASANLLARWWKSVCSWVNNKQEKKYVCEGRFCCSRNQALSFVDLEGVLLANVQSPCVKERKGCYNGSNDDGERQHKRCVTVNFSIGNKAVNRSDLKQV